MYNSREKYNQVWHKKYYSALNSTEVKLLLKVSDLSVGYITHEDANRKVGKLSLCLQYMSVKPVMTRINL